MCRKQPKTGFAKETPTPARHTATHRVATQPSESTQAPGALGMRDTPNAHIASSRPRDAWEVKIHNRQNIVLDGGYRKQPSVALLQGITHRNRPIDGLTVDPLRSHRLGSGGRREGKRSRAAVPPRDCRPCRFHIDTSLTGNRGAPRVYPKGKSRLPFSRGRAVSSWPV